MSASGWTVGYAGKVVVDELRALPPDMRASYDKLVARIETVGLLALREPVVKSLGEKLWELRFSGRDGIARAVYITASGKRVVVVLVFVKKQQKTPRSLLDLARQRSKLVQ